MTEENTPQGDNVVEMPQQGAPTPEQVAEIQTKIAAAMNDERLQEFASAVILGNQLYAWGAMFLTREPGHDPAVLHTMLEAIQSSMIDETGVPRPFAEQDLLKNIEELLPFMKKEIKVHEQQREAINKLSEEMIQEAVNGSKEEKNESE